MSHGRSRGFAYSAWFSSQSLKVPLIKVILFFLLPLSVAADIHIQLASETLLNTTQILGYGILSLPIELVNQSVRWEGPRGMDLEVQRKFKKQFIIQELFPLWLPCLPQWKVASGSDYLFVTLTARGPVCQLCWEISILSLGKCSAWKCLALSLPLFPHHSETFLIAFLIWESKVSLNKMRNKQWIGWSPKLPWSATATEEGKIEEVGGKWRLLKVFQNFENSIFQISQQSVGNFWKCQACLWASLKGEDKSFSISLTHGAVGAAMMRHTAHGHRERGSPFYFHTGHPCVPGQHSFFW